MRKRVVILTSRFPLPLTKGDRLRAYQHIKTIAEHSDVFLFSICEAYPSMSDMDKMSRLVKKVTIYQLGHATRLRNLATRIVSTLPLQVSYFYDEKISDMIRHQVEFINPHGVYTQLIRMAPYAQALNTDAVSVLDYMDSMVLNDLASNLLDTWWKKLLIPSERSKVKKYETEIYSAFDTAYIISQRDRDHFADEIKSQLSILSNGVDSIYYHPTSDRSPSYDIGFCGNLSYHANQKALEQLHLIVATHGSISAAVAGADMKNENDISQHQNIHLLGYLDDIRKLYRDVKIFVAPIYTGSGLQNKILESMACGTPCITTTFVNKSIGAEPNKEILIADNKTAFIEKINHLLSHPLQRQIIADNARSFVEQNYNWRVQNKKLVEDLNLL